MSIKHDLDKECGWAALEVDHFNKQSELDQEVFYFPPNSTTPVVENIFGKAYINKNNEPVIPIKDSGVVPLCRVFLDLPKRCIKF